MAEKMQVGQVVRNVWYVGMTLRGVRPCGQLATIVEFNDGGSYFRVKWHDPVFEAAFKDADRHDGKWWSPQWWKVYIPPFTADKPCYLRNGQKVKVTKLHYPDRPYLADVELNGITIPITFDPNGRFYTGFECPIDLVNI